MQELEISRGFLGWALTLLAIYEELQTVVIRVQEGAPEAIQSANRRGQLAGPGLQGNIIETISRDGVNLDSQVTVRYGEWVREMIEKTRLVSLNAEVQFALSSDHAKSFWPYIDSMTRHTYIDEGVLAALARISHGGVLAKVDPVAEACLRVVGGRS